ncbi:hypothetical protein CPB83DRAFT_911543 [Crepidotus variabilis]|uniref:Uncharacterized protein n=1 Tax=Crepidotus variabilis TaxID=179855 RepID=A0A9P6E422_9AGAR|nr:hypothetical protein CPB83DRAFT_911543 [Crepidotus variabilis]
MGPICSPVQGIKRKGPFGGYDSRFYGDRDSYRRSYYYGGGGGGGGYTNVHIKHISVNVKESGQLNNIDGNTTITSVITTVSHIAEKTEEIVTKLDHVINLFDKIDTSALPEDTWPDKTSENHVRGAGHIQNSQVMVSSTNPKNMLDEALDQLKDLRTPAGVARSSLNLQEERRHIQNINEMLVSGFISQLDVAVSKRLPYLHQALDRVGVTLMARLLQNQTQEEQTRRWQAEERRFQRDIEELQIEKRRVQRQLEEKELQLERLRESMAGRTPVVSMFHNATNPRIGGRTLMNVNVVNVVIEHHQLDTTLA